MPTVTLSDWNQFLSARPNAHLLQTGEWGELKSMFEWKPVRIVNVEDGVQILFRKLPLGFTIGYLPKANPAASLWHEIDSICKQNRAVFLKLEPDLWTDQTPDTQHLALRTSPHNIQPPRTILIDLTGSEDEILARMKQKTRYNIRLAEKKGVTVRPWDDISAFHDMMLVTSERDGFGVHSEKYYRQAYELLHPKGMCELFLAEFEGKPLAALFVARHGNRAYYLYGASTDEERNRMPTYLLQWAAIKWAKACGAEEYDLWGVPDEEQEILEANFEARHDGLWGVYRFKRGFGGQLKRAAQALDRVYNPLLYQVYLRTLRNRE
jgi:peptidoglycan pentaglycine glycine transferase (the first glycine)